MANPKRKPKVATLKNGIQKCPTCGSKFIEDMHPFAVEFRKLEAERKANLKRKRGQ